MMIPEGLSLGDRAAPPATLVGPPKIENVHAITLVSHPALGLLRVLGELLLLLWIQGTFLNFLGQGGYGWLIKGSSPNLSGSTRRDEMCVFSVLAIHKFILPSSHSALKE